MILKNFVIPEIINKDRYNLEKEELKQEFNIERKGNHYYLYPKEVVITKPFLWNVYEFSKQVKKKYGEVIYVIAEKDPQDNIHLLIGNTLYLEKKFHSQYEIKNENFKNDVNKLQKMLELNKNTLEVYKIVIFNVNLSEEEIKKIFENENIVIDNNLKNLLWNLPVHENILKKALPFAAGIIIYMLMMQTADLLAKKQNEIIRNKNKNIIEAYQRKIKEQNDKILKYKKELYEMKKVVLNKNKKIYKGTK